MCWLTCRATRTDSGATYSPCAQPLCNCSTSVCQGCSPSDNERPCCSFLAFAGSLQSADTNFFVTDRISTPPQWLRARFSEHAVLLPRCLLPTSHLDLWGRMVPAAAATEHNGAAAETSKLRLVHSLIESSIAGAAHEQHVPTRQALGLPTSSVVFCNFGLLHKIEPIIFNTWMHAMRAVPGRLWLLLLPADAADNLRYQSLSLLVEHYSAHIHCGTL